jgi:hypothetical protein
MASKPTKWRIPEGTKVSCCPKCGRLTYHLDTHRGNWVRIDLDTLTGHWHSSPECYGLKKKKEAKNAPQS